MHENKENYALIQWTELQENRTILHNFDVPDNFNNRPIQTPAAQIAFSCDDCICRSFNAGNEVKLLVAKS